MNLCQNDNCDKTVKAKGLCQYHYYKSLYPHNSKRPNTRSVKDYAGVNRNFDEDFWDFVKKELSI